MSSEKNKNSLFPECWEDDVRMSVLFAPFRPKSVNPENYVSKLNFWKNMIKRYCEFKGCAQFCKSELLLNFQRNEKSPYGLDHVIEDMYTNAEIKTLTQFNDHIEDGWSMWALKTFVKKPVIWGIQKTVGTKPENQNDYIFMDVLQRQASDIYAALQRLDKNIVQCDDLNTLADINLNADGRNLCLRYLHSLKKIYVEYEIRNGKKEVNVIKVPKSDEIACPLTDLEWTLLNLENAQKMLDKCIKDLHIEMKDSEDSARSYVREGKKLLAKSCLRRKHLIEQNLEKRLYARDNIHSLITNMQDAQHNGLVLDAIKLGSNTLKSLLNKSNLNLDNVDDIILEVKETLDLNEEVQKTVSEPLVNVTIDDSALEEELNEILSKSTEEIQIPEQNEKEDEELLKRLEKLGVTGSSSTEEKSNLTNSSTTEEKSNITDSSTTEEKPPTPVFFT